MSTGRLGGDAAFLEARRQHVASLEQFAKHPYPQAAATHSLAELRRLADRLSPGERAPAETPIVLTGRIHQKRTLSKKLCFYELRDGLGGSLQLVANANTWLSSNPDIHSINNNNNNHNNTHNAHNTHNNNNNNNNEKYDDLLLSSFRQINDTLKRGDIITASGCLAKTKTGEPSLLSSSLALLSPCLHDVPHRIDDPNLKLSQQYLLMRTSPDGHDPVVSRAIRLRARLYAGLRQFLDGRGFVEVETPVLSPVAGGASAQPFVTHAREAFGGKTLPLYLRIAPELYLKQLLVGGFDRVYEIGKQFRNEGIDGRHNPEFSTLEFYQAYATAGDLMTMTEELLDQVVSYALKDELDPSRIVHHPNQHHPNQHHPNQHPPNQHHPPPVSPPPAVSHLWTAKPFRRISVIETLEQKFGRSCIQAVFDMDQPALSALALDLGAITPHELAHGAHFSVPKLVDRIIGESVEPLCVGPTFLVDLPLCLSPLAMESKKLPGTADRFEMFSQGMELINAYSELNDPAEQRERFAQQQKFQSDGDPETHPPDEHFCHALEYAMPPAAGWGLGIDRLLMQMLQTEHIRDVIITPRPHP